MPAADPNLIKDLPHSIHKVNSKGDGGRAEGDFWCVRSPCLMAVCRVLVQLVSFADWSHLPACRRSVCQLEHLFAGSSLDLTKQRGLHASRYYCTVGMDAEVAYRFHRLRTTKPWLSPTRKTNIFWYIESTQECPVCSACACSLRAVVVLPVGYVTLCRYFYSTCRAGWFCCPQS